MNTLVHHPIGQNIVFHDRFFRVVIGIIFFEGGCANELDSKPI